MNNPRSKKKEYFIKSILFFIIFLVEFYLYVFVRNENILDLLVTIAAGILFIVSLTLYFVHFKDKNSAKPN